MKRHRGTYLECHCHLFYHFFCLYSKGSITTWQYPVFRSLSTGVNIIILLRLFIKLVQYITRSEAYALLALVLKQVIKSYK
jgi:hypothetical protein